MRIALTLETDGGVDTINSHDSNDIVTCGFPDRGLDLQTLPSEVQSSA